MTPNSNFYPFWKNFAIYWKHFKTNFIDKQKYANYCVRDLPK